MIPPDATLAELCAETYDRFNTPTWCIDEVRAFRYADPGGTVVVFPGSVAPVDWARDLLALPAHAVLDHADLGTVPLGFWLGLEAVLARIEADVGGKPLVLAGHSLGGARALLAAALLASAGRRPRKTTAFAPPRVGSLNGLIREAAVAYRYRDDPVPLVPLGFAHPCPLVQLAPPLLELDVLADHHLANYRAVLSP